MTKVQEKPPVADKRVPKTRIKVATLRAALKDVSGIVEARHTIPMLANVVLQVRDQVITLTATDLDHWAIRDCPSDDRDPGSGSGTGGPGSKEWLYSIRGFSVCLPAKPLEAVLGELDGDAMLVIEAPAEVSDRWAGQVTLKAGPSRFRLHALPVADFPLLEALAVESSFEIGCSQLGDILTGVDHAISTEETRYYLNGVFLHAAELDLRFVATDGHRLARWQIEDGPMGSASFPEVIVGRKTVGVLEKLLAGAVKAAGENASPPIALVEANAGASRLRFVIPAEGGEVEIVAKAIDGTFPDYNRVIPSAPERCVTVSRTALSAAVKRVAVMAAEKSRAVKLEFAEGRITISARSPELGEAVEELACSYAGPAFVQGFDAKYLRETLAAIGSDTVALRSNGESDGAVRVTGWEGGAEVGALLQVIMPVRV